VPATEESLERFVNWASSMWVGMRHNIIGDMPGGEQFGVRSVRIVVDGCT